MKVIILFLVLNFFYSPLLYSQIKLLNQSPNDWTLIIKGEKVGIPAFGEFALDVNSDCVEFYALETIKSEIYRSNSNPFEIWVYGFCRLIADQKGDFILQNLEVLPILLHNIQDQELFIEYHKSAFLLKPGEWRELSDIYITYDSIIELKISSLVDKENLMPSFSRHRVDFKEGKGIVDL